MVDIVRQHRLLVVILILYVGLAISYSLANPLFEAPDEVWHYEYVRWLDEGRGLPLPQDVGAAPWAQEGSQPPLYYLAVAALVAPVPTDNAADVIRYNPHAAVGNAEAFGNRNMLVHGRADAWPWRGVTLAAHLARFFSVLLGAVTVFFTYLIATVALPRWTLAAVLAAALVAFNPQFLFISASVSNDNLITAVATIGLWLCVWLVERKERPALGWWVLLGGLVGAAALSKLSGLLLAGLALLTLMIVARRQRSWRTLFASVLVVGVTAIAVAGWWYWRNWRLFGDPLALNVMFAVLPGRTAIAGPAELVALAPGVWRSFWAVFGWFNVVADAWVYWWFAGISLVGVVGWLVGLGGWLVRRGELRRVVRPAPALLLALWMFVVAASLVRWAQISYPQGRLLFPAIGAGMTLLAAGLLAWWPLRWQATVTAGLCATLFAIAALAPFRWIMPAYAPPALLPANASLPNPTAVAVGPHIRLLGYEIAQQEVRPGEALDLTLYWQTDAPLTTTYSVFVHATDENGILQAQRDSFPGLGNLPTSEWAPGMVIPDRHRLALPQTLPSPARLQIDVGLYDAATAARLPVGATDFATLGYVTVPPVVGDSGLPNPTRINFGDKIALVGYDFDKRVLRPGDVLKLSLWWEGLAPMDRDYVVFTHLVEPPDTVRAQKDAMPQRGAAPTSTWQVGQRVADSYRLKLPPDAPPGTYFVEIGLYDKDSYERLPVNFSDKGVVLGRVRWSDIVPQNSL